MHSAGSPQKADEVVLSPGSRGGGSPSTVQEWASLLTKKGLCVLSSCCQRPRDGAPLGFTSPDTEHAHCRGSLGDEVSGFSATSVERAALLPVSVYPASVLAAQQAVKVIGLQRTALSPDSGPCAQNVRQQSQELRGREAAIKL